MSTDDDQIVAEYLQRLGAAARVLPADRAGQLVEEITHHIAEARAAAATAGGAAASGGAPSVRNILERLGDPADIVRTAAETSFGDAPAGPLLAGPLPAGLAQATPLGAGHSQAATGRAGALEICAVILLLIGGIVVPVVGWVVGVVLLWTSPRWKTGDKVLGTLVWPGGLLAPFALLLFGGLAAGSTSGACQGGSAPAPVPIGQAASVTSTAASCTTSGVTAPWLITVIAVALLALSVAGPIFTAICLLRRAGRAAAVPTTDSAALQPA
jgi:hypothetical protein